MQFNIGDRVLYSLADFPQIGTDTGTVVPANSCHIYNCPNPVWVKWDSDGKTLWADPQNLTLIERSPNPVTEWSAWDDFLLTNADSMRTLPTKTLALIKAGFFAEQGQAKPK